MHIPVQLRAGYFIVPFPDVNSRRRFDLLTQVQRVIGVKETRCSQFLDKKIADCLYPRPQWEVATCVRRYGRQEQIAR